MLERILEHMNNEHGDVLPLYVRHFNKRDDVTEARLVDVNEEEMILTVNGGEKVSVKLTKRTPLEEMHLELVKMAKTARQALGIPAPDHHKEKGHGKEEKLKIEIDEFIKNFRSAVLATVTKNGDPFASYAPFLRYSGGSYIFISATAEHFENMKENGKLDVLFIEDEEKTSSISLRKRVRYRASAEVLEKNEKTEEILDRFEEKDRIIKMTRKMPDFRLIKLNLLEGRYVKGPGQAFDITEDGRVAALTENTHVNPNK